MPAEELDTKYRNSLELLRTPMQEMADAGMISEAPAYRQISTSLNSTIFRGWSGRSCAHPRIGSRPASEKARHGNVRPGIAADSLIATIYLGSIRSAVLPLVCGAHDPLTSGSSFWIANHSELRFDQSGIRARNHSSSLALRAPIPVRPAAPATAKGHLMTIAPSALAPWRRHYSFALLQTAGPLPTLRR